MLKNEHAPQERVGDSEGTSLVATAAGSSIDSPGLDDTLSSDEARAFLTALTEGKRPPHAVRISPTMCVLGLAEEVDGDALQSMRDEVVSIQLRAKTLPDLNTLLRKLQGDLDSHGQEANLAAPTGFLSVLARISARSTEGTKSSSSPEQESELRGRIAALRAVKEKLAADVQRIPEIQSTIAGFVQVNDSFLRITPSGVRAIRQLEQEAQTRKLLESRIEGGMGALSESSVPNPALAAWQEQHRNLTVFSPARLGFAGLGTISYASHSAPAVGAFAARATSSPSGSGQRASVSDVAENALLAGIRHSLSEDDREGASRQLEQLAGVLASSNVAALVVEIGKAQIDNDEMDDLKTNLRLIPGEEFYIACSALAEYAREQNESLRAKEIVVAALERPAHADTDEFVETNIGKLLEDDESDAAAELLKAAQDHLSPGNLFDLSVRVADKLWESDFNSTTTFLSEIKSKIGKDFGKLLQGLIRSEDLDQQGFEAAVDLIAPYLDDLQPEQLAEIATTITTGLIDNSSYAKAGELYEAVAEHLPTASRGDLIVQNMVAVIENERDISPYTYLDDAEIVASCLDSEQARVIADKADDDCDNDECNAVICKLKAVLAVKDLLRLATAVVENYVDDNKTDEAETFLKEILPNFGSTPPTLLIEKIATAYVENDVNDGLAFLGEMVNDHGIQVGGIVESLVASAVSDSEYERGQALLIPYVDKISKGRRDELTKDLVENLCDNDKTQEAEDLFKAAVASIGSAARLQTAVKIATTWRKENYDTAVTFMTDYETELGADFAPMLTKVIEEVDSDGESDDARRMLLNFQSSLTAGEFKRLSRLIG